MICNGSGPLVVFSRRRRILRLFVMIVSWSPAATVFCHATMTDAGGRQGEDCRCKPTWFGVLYSSVWDRVIGPCEMAGSFVCKCCWTAQTNSRQACQSVSSPRARRNQTGVCDRTGWLVVSAHNMMKLVSARVSGEGRVAWRGESVTNKTYLSPSLFSFSLFFLRARRLHKPRLRMNKRARRGSETQLRLGKSPTE